MVLYDFTRPITKEWRGLRPDQWPRIEPHLPPKNRPWRKADRKGGRPPVSDRLCFEALVWLVLTDGTWKNLPKRFCHWRTAQRRLKEWRKRGQLERMWRAFLKSLWVEERLKVERALGLTGTRRRAPWRFQLDVRSEKENLRRRRPNWQDGRRPFYAWRFRPSASPGS